MKKHSKVGNRKGKPAYRTPSEFQSRVFSAVKKIPSGSTKTYKQIATEIGAPRAYRAVGNALNKNTDSTIPCHRVIRSDGDLGGYNRGRAQKRKLLTQEKQSNGKSDAKQSNKHR